MIVRRAWVANAILLASAVIVTTVAIEFVFRRLPGERFILTRSTLCSPEYPAQRSDYLPFTTPRSATVHAKRAEFSVDYIFDHNGYRTSAQPVPVPETADSIIFVGDSFTLGWGVDYDRTFPGILAREFGEKNIRVYNAGYKAGYSPDSYAAFLAAEGEALRPRAVVTTIYSGNDFEDIAMNIWRTVDANGYPTSLDTTRVYPDFTGRMMRYRSLTPDYACNSPLGRSYTFMGMMNLLDPRLRALRKKMAEAKPKNGQPLISEDETYSRFVTSLRGIGAFCRQQEALCLFAVIDAPPKQRPWKYYRLALQSVRDAGFDPIELGVVVPQKGYFPGDGHFNPVGHEAVARRLRGALDGAALGLNNETN